MNIILLQSPLSDEEIRKLINEFPDYLFLAPKELGYKKLGEEEWSRIEVIYGNRLTAEELEKAHELRWIHSPTPNLDTLCRAEIGKKEKILVTCSREENTSQIGEFVIGGVLAFAKNLFHWEAADRNPATLWDSKWRESMWTLKGRTFLQIGLGSVGTEVSRLAGEFGMKVWGVKERRSFHPHCRKIFTWDELHSVLPMADVVSIALPRNEQKEKLFRKEEIELMKQDSILAIAGYKKIIDEEALAHEAETTGKFRGILLDAFYQVPVSPNSKLWSIPNILVTPEVAPRPKLDEKQAFRLFRYNLRQYLHGNFSDMKNITGKKQMSLDFPYTTE